MRSVTAAEPVLRRWHRAGGSREVQAGFDANPFSAAHLAPQRNEYLFADSSESLPDLAERFRTLRHPQAAIVGRHGTGKSTLAANLATLLSQHFDSVFHHVCQADSTGRCDIAQLLGQARLPISAARPLVVLDGFERLALWQRCRFLWRARRARTALLLTLHRPAPLLPTLYRTDSSLAICRQVVLRRLEGHPELAPWILERLEHHWPEYRGNTREALFAMYDAFEQLRRIPRLADRDAAP